MDATALGEIRVVLRIKADNEADEFLGRDPVARDVCDLATVPEDDEDYVLV